MKPYNEQEFNKLCAEFLGWEQGEDGRYWKETPTESSNWYVDEMYFHSDWNWIMEVVEKIETTHTKYTLQWEYDDREEFADRGGKYKAYWFTLYVKDEILHHLNDNRKLTRKEAIVESIWYFLNWYNEQKQ